MHYCIKQFFAVIHDIQNVLYRRSLMRYYFPLQVLPSVELLNQAQDIYGLHYLVPVMFHILIAADLQ